MIPEYKCRRCERIIDGMPMSIPDTYKPEVFWALSFAIGRNVTNGIQPLPLVIQHASCLGGPPLHHIGVGLADLIGAREG